MSIVTSNTSTKRGLVQFYEKEIGMNYGDVSGDTELLAEFISRVNNALDDYLLLWAKTAGPWEADDLNFTDFDIITANIVSGQRDYSFLIDGNSNRVNTVYKVLILPSATATGYIEVNPVDENNTDISNILLNTNTGVPIQYGKKGSSILFDLIPSYNATNGVKMVVGREGSYLLTTDTTKVIGVPVYHDYFYKKPAYEFAKIHGLNNLSQLEKDVIDLEGNERLRITGKIQEFFGRREKDNRKIMTGKKILYI